LQQNLHLINLPATNGLTAFLVVCPYNPNKNEGNPMLKKVRNVVFVMLLPVGLFILFMNLAKGFGFHSLPILISQSMIPVAMGLMMVFTMEAGLFDLSIGARVVLSATFGAMLEPIMGFPGLVLGCLIGGLLGAGGIALLYRLLRLPSLVLSIGVVLVYEIISANMAGAAALLRISSASSALASFPNSFFITAGACILAYLLLYNTKIGCSIKAVGNDEAMAGSMGINTARVKTASYLISGVFCAVAALLLASSAAAVSMVTGMRTLSMVFQPMIGVFIGLQLIRILDNLPLLIFAGQLSLTIIFNGFIAMGLTDHIQRLILGLFLIVVMAVSANTGELKGLKDIFKCRQKQNSMEV